MHPVPPAVWAWSRCGRGRSQSPSYQRLTKSATTIKPTCDRILGFGLKSRLRVEWTPHGRITALPRKCPASAPERGEQTSWAITCACRGRRSGWRRAKLCDSVDRCASMPTSQGFTLRRQPAFFAGLRVPGSGQFPQRRHVKVPPWILFESATDTRRTAGRLPRKGCLPPSNRLASCAEDRLGTNRFFSVWTRKNGGVGNRRYSPFLVVFAKRRG